MSLSGDLLAHIFHIHALYKQPTRGNYRKGKLLVPPVCAHLLWCIQRPRIHLQTQRVAVYREGGCLGKEKSRFACCNGTAASVALVSTGRWGSVCCCCPFCRKGDNAVSEEGTELRAAVALGRDVGAWLN